ncbi:MAG: hypothetical protein NZ957_05805 [Thaumarchaeota archaeon]|nr:hypothetical protein [Candidatus Calditenuaceae archaeon]
MASVREWIEKYKKGVEGTDWDLAAAEWDAMKSLAIKHFTETEGLNPRIAEKYRRRMTAATYRKPDVTKMVDNYTAKITRR